jgi:hypothetical protein
MIGYMSLEEQVDKDFERARRRSLVTRLAARLRGDPGKGKLPAFEAVRPPGDGGREQDLPRQAGRRAVEGRWQRRPVGGVRPRLYADESRR